MSIQRLLFIFIIFIYCSNVFTKSESASPILKCLAKEETQFHKNKIINAQYTLNQELIQTILGLPNLRLKNKYLNTICRNNISYSVSLKLLKEIISTKNIFIPYFNGKSTIDSIKQIDKQGPILFINHLNNIQKSAPTHNCINKIPAVKNFMIQSRYLQKHIQLQSIMPTSSEISIIFAKIQNLDKLYASCKKNIPK